ncbi:MAG TPA: MBL fold metallo-hydrolase [Planctomicrobium sp.]|nr:MBL fold metallo-hydrolase [Planctomicrobium sp.]
MAIHVELLGTGGYYANDRRHTPCVLFPELSLALDGGSSLFRIADRLKSSELRLFLTHAHLDHIVGLPYLLMPLLLKKLDRVTLHGTQETLDAVHNHLLSTPVFPVAIPWECEVISGTGSLALDSQHTLFWQPLPSHPGGSMAYRIEQVQESRKTIVSYITDTTVDGTYTAFIHQSDLLIHECNFPDQCAELAEKSGHSIASDVAHLAVTAQVRQMVVVHVDPSVKEEDPVGIPEMRLIFPDTQLGVDGLMFDVDS